ncbi:MAG TPA: histidinol-phosphate transaminase [Bellilinea sp.]|nr:histidinol-phosphate transaminase [Bellilinea sp.]
MAPIDYSKLARHAILNQQEYHPNMPPSAIMRERGIFDFIDLATNESPYGISPKAKVAIEQGLTELHRYPESGCYDLRRILASKYNLTPEHFLVDNGLDAVSNVIGLTFLESEDEIVIPAITFAAYENTARKMGAAILRAPLTSDYRIDVDGLLNLVTPHTKAVFICNPNNPTGTIIHADEYAKVLANLPETTLLVIDESFIDFVEDHSYPDTLATLADHPNLIIMRGFSKSLALAGLRVGYAIAAPEIIALMNRAREPFPVNRLAQVAAAAALEDAEFLGHTLEWNRESRARMTEGLTQLGFEVIPSQTNFLFVNLQQPAEPLWNFLFEHGVVIRKFDDRVLRNYTRICLGLPPALQRCLNVLAEILGKPAPKVFE